MLSSVLVLRAAPSLPQPYPARHQQAPGVYSSPCHSARHHARSLLCHASTSGRDTPQLKATLFKTVTRLNSAEEADDAALTQQLRQLVQQLEQINPTPDPAKSQLINGRWALLYTLPDKAKGDVQRDALQQALAASYDFFYKFVPIIAGSAVGRKASSRQGVKARGQFQTFDTTGGVVRNQARFQVLGQQGVINVDGPARVVSGDRIEAVFTEAEMRIGESLRIPFPIAAFSPKGYIDTLYLDEELRISKGDKGSLFIARRVDDSVQEMELSDTLQQSRV